MPIEWTTAAKFAAQSVKFGYSNRYTIQNYWIQLLAKIDTGTSDIVFTGHSAVGKTNLAEQMHGRARSLEYTPATESLTTEVVPLKIGNKTRLTRVLPGQQSRRVLDEIKSIDKNSALQGIIHLVDFGYVAPRGAAERQALIRNDGITDIEKLREHNLRAEIRELGLLISSIQKARATNGRPRWLLVAVNKVDLFYQKRDEVLAYYHPEGNGAFGKELKKLQIQLGLQNFGIYVAMVSADDTDFEWNGKTAKPELTRAKRDVLLRDFFESLVSIMEMHK